ncbi:hypothetical protein WG66_008169 [Moniliophthora roreri]|nr:hypothetical protein WG66_008169 [Moniliophthora roreri]
MTQLNETEDESILQTWSTVHRWFGSDLMIAKTVASVLAFVLEVQGLPFSVFSIAITATHIKQSYLLYYAD